MSLSLVSYPVFSSSGKVRNIFAGFDAVELEFKREDIQIISVSSGVDTKILITVLGDITGYMNIGEWVYLYAEGATYIYANSYQITTVVFSGPNTEITVNSDFIEVSAIGYLNYKQNWYLESKLVDPNNNDILKYPQLLQNDGSPAGVVDVNTSMLVDFLKNQILTTSQEVTNARNDCKVMYRESWREDDTAGFTLVDEDPIIIIFAAENAEIEAFVNDFEVPRIWEGYPFSLNILHSLQNYVGERVSVKFDELDINKDNITLNNNIAAFDPNDFGILQVDFNDNVKTIEDNTKYIQFNVSSSIPADYLTGDYDDTDYLTINTP